MTSGIYVRKMPLSDKQLDALKQGRLREWTKIEKEKAIKTRIQRYGHNRTEESKKKQSETRKKLFKEGKLSFSEEHKEKLRIKSSGENGSGWIDGRSYEGYPYEFKKIRRSKIIIKRDNYTCQLCRDIILSNTKNRFITIHHIDYDKNNNNLINLITLCTFCNSSVNKNRTDWTKFFQEKMNVIQG